MTIFKDKKFELFVFSAMDYHSLKEYFEEMAKKGWLIDKISYNLARYKKIKPTDLVFSVDIYPSLNSLDSFDKEDIESYINLCRESGWKFATSSKNLHIFYSNKEDKLIPIQTDDEIKNKFMEKTITHELIVMTIVLLLMFFSFRTSIPFNYENLFSNFKLIYPTMIAALILNTLFIIISDILWIVKAKRNINENKPLPRISYKFSKISGSISISISYLAILATVVALILDSFYGGGFIKFLLIPIALIPIVKLVFTRKIEPLKINRVLKIVILSVMIATIYVLPITLGIVSSSYREPENLEPGYLGFTLEDFNIEGTPRHKFFSKSGSILVPKKSEYSEVARGAGIETTFVESRNEKIAKYIFEGFIRDAYNDDRYISNADEYSHYDESYYIVRPYNEENMKNNVMILEDNKILILYTDIDLSKEEHIQVIDNKFIN